MSVREEQGMTTQTQDIAAWLDELERLAKAASAGRWTSEEWEFDSHEEIVAYLAAMLKHSPATLIGAVRLDAEYGRVVALTGNGPTSAANAVYISAASSQDMLGLIATYRAVLAERDGYREVLSRALRFAADRMGDWGGEPDPSSPWAEWNQMHKILTGDNDGQ